MRPLIFPKLSKVDGGGRFHVFIRQRVTIGASQTEEFKSTLAIFWMGGPLHSIISDVFPTGCPTDKRVEDQLLGNNDVPHTRSRNTQPPLRMRFLKKCLFRRFKHTPKSDKLSLRCKSSQIAHVDGRFMFRRRDTIEFSIRLEIFARGFTETFFLASTTVRRHDATAIRNSFDSLRVGII